MQKALTAEGHAAKNATSKYKLSEYEWAIPDQSTWSVTVVIEKYSLSLRSGGGLKDKGGGGLITFIPSKGQLIRVVQNLTP